MSASSSSREVLIAEAIGELGHMLEKVDALLPAISELTRMQLDANRQWAEQLSHLDSQVQALSEKVRLYAVKHLFTQLEEHAALTMRAHTSAMCESVSKSVAAALEPALQPASASRWHRHAQCMMRRGCWRAVAGFFGFAAAGALAGALLTWLWTR